MVSATTTKLRSSSSDERSTLRSANASGGGVDYGKALVRHLEAASGAERRSLIAEMLVQRSGDRDWEGHLSSTYTEACEIYGIDRKMVEAVVKRDKGKKVKKQAKQPLLEGK